MVRKVTEWPSHRGPITKIMPSDGCKGDAVPLALGQWYNFHEVGCHLGNVGLVTGGAGYVGIKAFLDGLPYKTKPKKKFRKYPIGYFHIEMAEVRTEEGWLYLFVAIDRTSKLATQFLGIQATGTRNHLAQR